MATDPGEHMPFTFACPAKAFYNSKVVKQVDVPTFSGSIGVLPKHVPIIAVLKPGVVSVFEVDGKVEKFFVSSGSLTVNSDSTVQLLAEEACSLADLDVNACRDELASAQRAAQGTSGAAAAEAQIMIETLEAAAAAASGQ